MPGYTAPHLVYFSRIWYLALVASNHLLPPGGRMRRIRQGDEQLDVADLA
jgi:hypothetical protein